MNLTNEQLCNVFVECSDRAKDIIATRWWKIYRGKVYTLFSEVDNPIPLIKDLKGAGLYYLLGDEEAVYKKVLLEIFNAYIDNFPDDGYVLHAQADFNKDVDALSSRYYLKKMRAL